MRKLIFGSLALVLVFFLFFNFKKAGTIKKSLAPVNVTLNGMDGPMAVQMISNFADNGNYTKDNGLKSVSAFYNIVQIAAIQKLMEIEHLDPTLKMDGIRIYLASNNAPTSSSAKLNINVFLVSTKPKTPTPNHTSEHGDYYLHIGGILSTSEVGVPVDDKGGEVLALGGSLYGDSPISPAHLCAKPSEHYIKDGLAQKWVRARYENGDKDDSPYNTISDWFRYDFIHEFFKAITDPNNHYSGLRIYLAKGPLDDNGNKRDVLILVPTKKSLDGKIDIDDYDCLEDLPGVHFPRPDTSGFDGGYDKGELCPFNCN